MLHYIWMPLPVFKQKEAYMQLICAIGDSACLSVIGHRGGWRCGLLWIFEFFFVDVICTKLYWSILE